MLRKGRAWKRMPGNGSERRSFAPELFSCVTQSNGKASYSKHGGSMQRQRKELHAAQRIWSEQR